MERNKFEEQLKEQLYGREITPSDAAWDKIAQELEVTKTSKTNNSKWYGIAAGFIGVLFISVLYFTESETAIDNGIQITDVEKEDSPINVIPKNTIGQGVHIEKVREEGTDTENRIVDSKIKEKTLKLDYVKSKKNTVTNNALVTSESEPSNIEKVMVPLSPSKTLIDAKVAEIVAQVAVLENENVAVTDAEIDSLLRGAQRQILEDKIFRDDRSVDAMALLADVEDELDRSFRDQIFDALKDGFLKVRTAVADRNR